MNDELEAFLSDLAAEGEEILFRPNPGNAGDALIAHATYSLFKRLGLRWSPASDEPGSATGRTVIYGGGGNLVTRYSDARRFLQAHSGRCRRLVLLPHTVDGHRDLLESLGPEVHLFLREDVSYDYCTAAAPRARLHRAHDLALGLPEEEAGPVGWLELLAAWRKARSRGMESLAHALLMIAMSRARWGGPGGRARPRGAVLHAFRTDQESSGGPIPFGNRDLSKRFQLGDMSPEWAGLSARLLLGWVDGASLVRTDRLHVAIACCLKDVPVEIHPNATYKLRAVFERSIDGRCGNARWAA